MIVIVLLVGYRLQDLGERKQVIIGLTVAKRVGKCYSRFSRDDRGTEKLKVNVNVMQMIALSLSSIQKLCPFPCSAMPVRRAVNLRIATIVRTSILAKRLSSF